MGGVEGINLFRQLGLTSGLPNRTGNVELEFGIP